MDVITRFEPDSNKEPVPMTEWMYEHTGGGCHWHRREFEYKGVRFNVCVTDGEVEGHILLGVYTDSDDISDVFAAYRYEMTDEDHDCHEVLPDVLEDLRGDLEAFEPGCGGRGVFCINIPVPEGTSYKCVEDLDKLDVAQYVKRAETMIECIAALLIGVWEESWDNFGMDDIAPIVEEYFKACGREDLSRLDFDEIRAQLVGSDLEYTHPSSKRFIERAIEAWDIFTERH